MNIDNKYREYFDIDEQYFPQVNDSTIKSANPDFWTMTYPHHTFIEMLNNMERVLARQEKRSLWIEGAYGTGKSQCAYALKKILEVPEDELRAYWDKYEPLKKKKDLLEKIIGHKQKGIVVAYRYASGMINSPRDLFFVVQETVKASLMASNLYAGENTLKESVIEWIDEPTHKNFFDALLKKPEWSSLFSQSSANEVLNALQKGNEVKTLMENIFRLADKEGITALNIDADRLISWLTDVMDHNDVKIVLIWDEFSDYFKNNRESLSEFQKLAELVNYKPFYFILVTHESGHLFTASDQTWKRVRDRFISVQISLPDNIALYLIGHAFNVKNAARSQWSVLANELNDRVKSSRAKVMTVAKIDNPEMMKNIMPIHPMAALILKNIASAFKSNQRSMFDFIKSSNMEDVKAFQWFIENTGPLDDYPFLTVDMLWNFFYEKGKDNLDSDIRSILDIFQDQQKLREDEKAVLKAVLIMQAIDKRLGGAIDLFKPTEQNLSYVFEGVSNLEGINSARIVKGLKNKDILISKPISGGRHMYVAPTNMSNVKEYEDGVRKNSSTSKLVNEGGLSKLLSLKPALLLRFESKQGTGEINFVTVEDFTRKINALRDKPKEWNFQAVIAFAKNESEATTFRKILRTAVADKQYENIIFIDVLSTPLGDEAFELYVNYAAAAMSYQGNNNTQSRDSSDKAKRILDLEWKNRILSGQMIVYSYANQEGEKIGNAQGIETVLQTIVMTRFPYVFDFAKNFSESQCKMTNMIQSAKSGIMQISSGVLKGIENHIFPTIWGIENYWENPKTASLPISIIKMEVDKRIEIAFSRDGQVSIGEIYDFLEDTYGFAPCNISSFIAGFLLKEYGMEPFRYSDSSGGHERMTKDKLAEMIGNYIGKSPKPTYIVKMTADEMAFYELTQKAWGIQPNFCSSAGQAAIAVAGKMRALKLPVWCLEQVDTVGIFDVVQKFIELVQKEGNEAHKIAVEMGRIASINPSLSDNLCALLTSENCQKGMLTYLNNFENGKLIELAKAIGAENNVISDIRHLFEVKHSCLWDKQTGEDEIRKLLIEYSVVDYSNKILNTSAHSLTETFVGWSERMKFIGISCEALKSKFSELAKIFDTLLKICRSEDILPDQLKVFHLELTVHATEITNLLNNDKRVFAEVYDPYLEDLSVDDIATVKSKLQMGLFNLTKTDCNLKVKETAEEFRKNQLKTQLFSLWKNKTGTRNPNEWSNLHRTPILCCVSNSEFDKAKKAFETLNRYGATDTEIKDALSYFESTTDLFDNLMNEDKRNEAFKRDIIGEYSSLLSDLDKVRNTLDRLSIDIYDWRENPSVKSKVKHLAEAEYNAGGSDMVFLKIDEMDDAQLKQYLKRLVKDNITVGIEILANLGGKQSAN